MQKIYCNNIKIQVLQNEESDYEMIALLIT